MRALFYLCLVVVILSCKERIRTEPKTLPDAIRLLLSRETIEQLDSYDLIHYGKNPPTIEGSYAMNPLSPWGVFDNDGKLISEVYEIDMPSYTFTFYNQSSSQPKLSFSFIGAEETDKGEGKNGRTYISGNGNYFSVFSEVEGIAMEYKSSVIPDFYDAIFVLSGEVTLTGVKNLRGIVKLTAKFSDYKDQKLLPVGYSRRIKDGDGFSEKVTGSFKVIATKEKMSNALSCAVCTNNSNN